MNYREKDAVSAEKLSSEIGSDLSKKLVVAVLNIQSEIIRIHNVPIGSGGYIRFYGDTMVWYVLGDKASEEDLKSFGDRKDMGSLRRYILKSLKTGRGLTSIDLRKLQIEFMNDSSIQIFPKRGEKILKAKPSWWENLKAFFRF